tara:strand:+ start:942 stop:1070 length:129 start_codon:yes stop_codon:yes gene_type:complete
MFIATVPFKGVNPNKVYSDIKARNIQWPADEDFVKNRMSFEA